MMTTAPTTMNCQKACTLSMTSPVVSTDPITDIRRVAQVLLDYSLPAVPVVSESGELLGIISRGDILRTVVADPPLSLWA